MARRRPDDTPALERRLQRDLRQLRANARLVDRIGRSIDKRIKICPRCGWPAPPTKRR